MNFAKITMKLHWNHVYSKNFSLKLAEYFGDTIGHPELAISGSCMMMVYQVKLYLYFQFFSCLFFQYSEE